jgi:hypothetical protein
VTLVSFCLLWGNLIKHQHLRTGGDFILTSAFARFSVWVSFSIQRLLSQLLSRDENFQASIMKLGRRVIIFYDQGSFHKLCK